ncbi:MAG TPA: hypothetical protein VG273_23160 [Bryobacteraceae bacterium]|nr:hypothetical protein [Bryobacteraceae bacterium]
MTGTTTVASGSVAIWTVPLGAPRSGFLSEDDAARAARFLREKDRIYWTHARLALRSVLAGYTGQTPESLRFVCNENGKPALVGAEIEFNLSHAGDFALIAVSRSRPVGIDLERIRAEVDIAALLRRLGETDLPETIPELYQRWTRREARSKAAGGQLFVMPPEDIEAFDIEGPKGYAAAVAVRSGKAVVRR